MPRRFAWTCLLAALPLLTAPAAQAEQTDTTQASLPPPHMPRLSSRYGYREHPIDGARRFHAGIDIPGAAGSPVLASAAGVVRFAGSAGGYGRMVEIDHGGGLRTRYAHLAQIAVTPGMHVAVGAAIGRMGSTGRSTGTHLHFEVRRDGRAVDPLAYLSQAAVRPLPEPRQWESDAPHISEFAKARNRAGQRADAE